VEGVTLRCPFLRLNPSRNTLLTPFMGSFSFLTVRSYAYALEIHLSIPHLILFSAYVCPCQNLRHLVGGPYLTTEIFGFFSFPNAILKKKLIPLPSPRDRSSSDVFPSPLFEQRSPFFSTAHRPVVVRNYRMYLVDELLQWRLSIRLINPEHNDIGIYAFCPLPTIHVRD